MQWLSVIAFPVQIAGFWRGGRTKGSRRSSAGRGGVVVVVGSGGGGERGEERAELSRAERIFP